MSDHQDFWVSQASCCIWGGHSELRPGASSLPPPPSGLRQARPSSGTAPGPGLQKPIFGLFCFLDDSPKLDPSHGGILAPALKITIFCLIYKHLKRKMKVIRNEPPSMGRTTVSLPAFFCCTDRFIFKGKSKVIFFFLFSLTHKQF